MSDVSQCIGHTAAASAMVLCLGMVMCQATAAAA